MLKKRKINIIDTLSIFLLIYLCFCLLHNNKPPSLYHIPPVSSRILFQIIGMGLIYILCRIGFQLNMRLMHLFLLIITAIFIYELFEVINIIAVNGISVIKLIGGSFNNPGPFAGLLTVSLSVFLPFYLKKSFFISWIFLLFSIICVFILPFTISRAAWVSAIIAMIIYFVRNTRLIGLLTSNPFLIVILFLIGLMFSYFIYCLKKPSADGRIYMNKICINKIVHSKVLGSGLGTYCGAYGDEQLRYFLSDSYPDFPTDWNACYNKKNRLVADAPNRSFNEILRLGIEAGPIAMILFILIVIISCVLFLKNNNLYGYSFIALMVFCSFSYPLDYFIFRFILSILLAIAGTLASTNKNNAYSIISLSVIFIILLSICSFYISTVIDRKNAYTKWLDIQAKHDEYDELFANDCSVLLPIICDNQDFLYKYGLSLHNIGRYKDSNRVLYMGTKISSDPMFWNILGQNYKKIGNNDLAEKCYKHAFWMLPNRIYPLYLLAELYLDINDETKYIDIKTFIDSFVPKKENELTLFIRQEINKLEKTYRCP